MSSVPFSPDDFRRRLAARFPGARLEGDFLDFGAAYLRFELGDPHPNGSGARIGQAAARGAALFRAAFPAGGEVLVVIVKDWDSSGVEWRPSEPPGHLWTLIRGFDASRAAVETLRGDEDDEYSYRQLLFEARVAELDVDGIVRGIAHLDQGRTPRINASAWLVSLARGVALHMYDDRGLLVWAAEVEALRPLYDAHREWLIDHPEPNAWVLERFAGSGAGPMGAEPS